MTYFLQYYKKNFYPGFSLLIILALQGYFRIYSQTAAFSYEKLNNCAPTVVTFTNESTQGPGIQYIWDFGKGGEVVSDKMILQEAYIQSGDYTVTLKVVQGTDTATASEIVTINQAPDASFTADITNGCLPLEVNFTNNSESGDSPIGNVLWDFRDGTTSPVSNPSKTYANPGVYDVLLTVTDENGCSDYHDAIEYIKVSEAPLINFTVSDSVLCSPQQAVSFTNLTETSQLLDYTWIFGNGDTLNQVDGSTIYEDAGTYDVTLIGENESGCSGSLTKENYIFVGPQTAYLFAVQNSDTFIFNNDTLCPGTFEVHSTLPGFLSRQWTVRFNNEMTIYTGNHWLDLEIADSGSVEITLQYAMESACPDSISKSFMIDYVGADFIIDKQYLCQLPETINISDRTGNAESISWYFRHNSYGNEPDTMIVIDNPESFAHKYAREIIESRYPVKLVAVNNNGCIDSTSKDIIVRKPVARFMPDTVSGCAPLEVVFSDSSKSDAVINKRTYLINGSSYEQFDDADFTYTFPQRGEYDVTLVIENDSNCVDTSYSVKIKTGSKVNPDISVIPFSVCNGQEITLADISSPSENIHFRSFGSHGIFRTRNLSETVAQEVVYTDSAGYYDIFYRAEDNGCITDSLFKDALYVRSPSGSFHEEFDCDSPLVYTFVADNQLASSVTWEINDSFFTGTDTVIYEFPASGDYTVKLTAVNDTSLCTVQKSKVINVRQTEAIFYTDTLICLGQEIFFDGSASKDYIDSCYNEGFLWDFGDGLPPRRTFENSHPHRYIYKGIFPSRLTVKGDNGCESVKYQNIHVMAPEPDFSVSQDEGCAPGFPVIFTSENSDPAIAAFEWYFGDGYSDGPNIPVVTHTYNSPSGGEYLTRMVATDIYGCQAVKVIPITIHKINPAFYADRNYVCLGEEVNFHVQNEGYDSISFVFGDGSPASPVPLHTYNQAGIYDVSLTVHQSGCSDTEIRNEHITVQQPDARYLPSDTSFICYPAQVTFAHLQSVDAVEGRWTFAEGVHSNYYNPVNQYTYTSPGAYHTSLWIRTVANCQDTYNKTITVAGPVAQFDFNPKTICYGEEVSFTLLNTEDVNEFIWLFGDGDTSILPNPAHHYYARGEIIPAIRISNDDCEVVLSSSLLNVSEVRANFVFAFNRSIYCIFDSLQVYNISYLNSKNIWRLEGTEISANPNPDSTALLLTGEFDLELIVEDTRQCKDSITKTFRVNPNPVFQIAGDTIICPNGSTLLSIETVDPSWSIQWHPAAGLDDTNSFTPEANPDTATRYTAEVSDTAGCSSQQQISISLDEPPEISRIPEYDTSIYIGQQINLLVLSDKENSQYLWSPDYKISCRDCDNPVVAPEQDITYEVTITDDCYQITESFPVEVIVDFYLEIPSAFTPNGDDNNDVLMLETRNIAEIQEFKIYNRWGNLVFSTTNPEQGWDGKVKGKPQNADTYVYIIRAVSRYGYKVEKKGNVVLVR